MSTASDNTAKWAVRKFGGAGLPVGFEYFTTNPNIPAGSLPLLGGVYSRTLYKDLWNWVQEQTGYLITENEWQEKSAANKGNVPFYSTGDGTTTFRVPSLKCWVKGTDGSTQLVGSYLEAGLPNITGDFGLRPVDGGLNVTWETNTGAIKATTQTDDVSICVAKSSSHGPLVNVTIDASRSSAIYGNSDTVQPKSIVGMWLVKAYGTITNVGSADVSNIAQGLTELENRVTPIEKGGTGASDANGARTNLGLKGFTSNQNFTDLDSTYTATPTNEMSLNFFSDNNKFLWGAVLNCVFGRGTGYNENNGGQLIMGNSSMGLLYRTQDAEGGTGWGPLRKVAFEDDLNGIVEQSSNHVKFANGFLLMFYHFSGGGVKTVYPNSASYWASVDTGAGGFNPGVTRVNNTQVNIQNVRGDTSTWCIGMGWA